MALIKCPECGKDVSDKSKVCVHCGYPLDENKAKAIEQHILNSQSAEMESEGVKKAISKTKLRIIALVAAFITLISIIGIGIDKEEFVEGITLGMTVDVVARQLDNDGVEYNGCYIVQNKEFHDQYCDFVYSFDEKGKLGTISITPRISNYKAFAELFDAFLLLYGKPIYMVEDYDSIFPMQKIVWQLEKGHFSLAYIGKSENTNWGTIDWGTFVLYEKNTGEALETTSINLHDEQKCSWGAAVGGCNYAAKAWSTRCGKHSCNIVGCDDFLFTDKINNVPLCARHFVLALNRVIYVGPIDEKILEEYSYWIND